MNRRIEFLLPSEVLAVLEAAKKHSQRDYAMILVTYSHGLRREETCELKLSDIVEGILTVRRLKGSLKTLQPLRPHKGKPLLDESKAIREWLRIRDNAVGEALFPSEKGGRLSGTQFYRIFLRYAVEAGLPVNKRNVHILKHSLATHLVRAGMDVAYVQQRLGHASIGSTMQYVHLSDAEASGKSHDKLMEVFR